MKKTMDKLINGLRINRKMLIFLISLALIGVIVGSIFVIILNNTDKTLIKDYLQTFLNNINDNKLNYLEALKNISISNYLYAGIIWLLGISIIGLPIIIFMYFMKCFMLGFTIASILINFKLKGIVLAFLYVFPHHIINLIIYTLLLSYAITLSLKIIEAVLKKKSINFKLIVNKYLMILITSMILITLTNFFEIYITPILIKIILPFIN
ncbi:MAG: stage II sporulation protein M [Bacilli bacterium]